MKCDNLVVTRKLDLTSTTFTSPVRLIQANITGSLSLRGAQLNAAAKDGDALVADGVKVGGSVYLDSSGDLGTFTFTAKGAIWLAGADITGQLSMSGAQLNAAAKDGDALVADGVRVGSDVLLDSSGDLGTFTAKGAIRLAGADITGQLSMRGAQLNRANEKGNVLVADRMKVGGGVYLDSSGDRRTFTAAGTLWLADARVGGSLYLRGVEFAGKTVALNAEGIQITGKLAWRPEKPVLGQVNLEGAAAGELDDDWTETRSEHNGYWPTDIRLDGFAYTAIRADNKATVADRLDWIRGKNKEKTQRRLWVHGTSSDDADAGVPFVSRPYEQLFHVYQRAGNDIDARKVAIAERRDQRKLGRLSWQHRRLNQLLDVTIGYGFRTSRALVLLIGLYAFVLVISLIALHHNGSIMPLPQYAKGICPKPSPLLCKGNYPCFNPFGYAFDTVVPIINLHQADYWRPDASTFWGDVCRWVSWAGTVLGWLLVTLAAAGYTGLARRVDAP
jgi:hypothetical protein